MGVTRRYVITGTASGIGQATKRLLEAKGARVIGVDIRDADVIADLTTEAGRLALVDQVRSLLGNSLDAVIANAGSGQVSLNFFGAVATLEGLRPLLANGDGPRATAVTSSAILHPVDESIVESCLAMDERAATEASARSPDLVYASSKRALARWIRRSAILPRWAGGGIPLNGVAPGVTRTPMTEQYIASERGRAMLDGWVPMPLAGYAQPAQIAPLLDWLTSPENTHITGQIVFIDGGSDAVLAGDDIWRSR